MENKAPLGFAHEVQQPEVYLEVCISRVWGRRVKRIPKA